MAITPKTSTTGAVVAKEAPVTSGLNVHAGAETVRPNASRPTVHKGGISGKEDFNRENPSQI